MDRRVFRFVGLLLALFSAPLWAADSTRIIGKVITRSGAIFEGPIRWDKNEASTLDILDGNKKIPEANRAAAERHLPDVEERQREVRFLGFTIARFEDDRFPTSAQSGIRFGHIKSLERLSGGRARLVLRSGEEVVLSGSSDIGSGVRGIVVEDPEEGTQELTWRDIEVIDFLPPRAVQSEFGERLYGTLLTRGGASFVGLICWDLDELFATDILDGDERGKRRKIPFGDIAQIERASSSSARVTLKSGEEMRLSGTNDVNDENRDILVLDPNIGQVRVSWDEFEKLVLTQPPSEFGFSFDGGRPLRGTVHTERGQSYTGQIRWDNDEEYTWEMLDGTYDELDFDIELGLIESIEKISSRASIVTLRDGRSFELRGSNDVDEDNKGILIRNADGEEKFVTWVDFSRVVFDTP